MSSPPSSIDRQRIHLALERWHQGTDRESNFRVLVESFYGPLHRFFQKRGLNPEDCRDLTQETFVRIYKGMDTFRRESEFETWLFAVAGNVFLKHRRDGWTLKRGAGVKPLSLSDPGLEERIHEPNSPAHDPLDRAIREQRMDHLRRAVESLPPKMRAVLKLSIYQERNRRQIAEALGLSEETVKAHLFQARKRLAEALAETHEKPPDEPLSLEDKT